MSRCCAAFEREMHEIFEQMPPRIATSAASGLGKDMVVRYLARLRNLALQTAPASSGSAFMDRLAIIEDDEEDAL
eukprot:8103989-Pyramimonas_sp.AAC.1